MSSISRIAVALERIAAALEKGDQYRPANDERRARAENILHAVSERMEAQVTGR